jgi:hypothetical protein
MRAAATAALGDLPAEPIVDPLAGFTKHRRFNAPIARALGMDSATVDIGRRMANCAGRLGLRLELPDDGPVAAHLESAMLCQCRLCPFCEWRRTRAWRARVIRGLTKLQEERPTMRAVFLTLTVRNCPLGDLRETIGELHAGWGRLSRLSEFPTAFWLRRTEVTLSGVRPPAAGTEAPSGGLLSCSGVPGWQQGATGRPSGANNGITHNESVMPLSCHPHLHALLVVPPSYFGRGYVKQSRWRELWMMSARLDYAPVVDIRNVYRKGGDASDSAPPVGAVCEAAKYATKGSDVMLLGSQLPELHHQLRGVRMIGVSGALAPYVPTKDPQGDELMDEPAQGPAGGLAARVAAVWDESAGSYRFEL